MAIHTTAYVAERKLPDGSYVYVIHSIRSEADAMERAASIGQRVDRVATMPAIVHQDGDMIEATLNRTSSDFDGIDHVIGRSSVRGIVRVTPIGDAGASGYQQFVVSLENPYVAMSPVTIDGCNNVLTGVRVLP